MLKHLSLHNDNTWIGATDENHERLWINVDGSDYLMDWATSEEPDNGAISHGEQNCMALRDMELPESEAKKLVSDENSQETLKSYGSSDIACDAVSSPGFICEKPGRCLSSFWKQYEFQSICVTSSSEDHITKDGLQIIQLISYGG